MRVVIPGWIDRAFTWIAEHLLPPPKPIGRLKVLGRPVTWLDVGIAAWGAAIVVIYAGMYGWHWLLFVQGIVAFALAAMLVLWFF